MKPRLSQLVADTAAILNLDERSVSVCARHLRGAGLIQKKGRGNSAAIMTPTDASNLVFGVMASNRLQDAPANVRRVRNATMVRYENNYGDLRPKPLNYQFLDDGFGRIPALGDAFDALIEQTVKGQPIDWHRARRYGGPGKGVALWFSIDRPGNLAHFKFSDGLNSESFHFLSDPRKAGRDEFDGMTISATITLDEIEKIAACLRGKKRAAK